MHPREDADTLRQSFGGIAADYDRFRPGPPREAVEWLLPGSTVDVLELGAGTGALTRLLVEQFPHVRAVEPDPRMRAVCHERVPGAEIVAGQAESIPAEDASFDAVIAASAWHWVDEDRALPEVARVLRPGGTFALLWSGPDRSQAWMRSLWAGGRELSAAEIEALDSVRRERHTVQLGPSSPFLEPERRVIRFTREMTKDELVGMAATYSAVITMNADERREYLDSLARYLERADVPVHGGLIDVPMRCRCWRTTRR